MQPALAEAPTWLRDPALSPDGHSIVFRSDGDLYVASVRTGEARRLRGTPAHEMRPVWLPDGRTIAFAADTHGSYDVYTTSADGSREPTRLTWHSRHELPVGVSPDGTELLIRSGRLDLGSTLGVYAFQLEGSEDESWPVAWTGIFALPVGGGMARPLIEPASLEAAWDPAGERLAFSLRPSTGTIYRKHERSPATWDVWLRERDGRTFRQLTTFDGHDTTPVWSAADGHLYFLSERSGSFNVWRMPIEGDGRAQQVTRHERHPVRGLTICAAGDIAYSFRGELHAGKPDGAIRKIPIELPTPSGTVTAERRDLSGALQEAVLVPATREAIVVARGRIYALDRWSTLRRVLLAEHVGAMSSPSLSSDGRRLLVVHDRGDRSELLLAELPGAAHSWVDAAAKLRVTAFSPSVDLIVRAALSPDGSRAAFTAGSALKLAIVSGARARVLLTHAEGLGALDQQLAWHPAGRHLALQWSNRQRREAEIAVLDTADRSVVNVTRSGFADTVPRWSSDGRALYWSSDRDGLRQFNGKDGTTDVYALFVDSAAQRAHEAGKDTGRAVAGADELARLHAALHADPAELSERRVRLTPTSAAQRSAAVAPSGRFLIRLQEVGKTRQLWLHPLPVGAPHRVPHAADWLDSADNFESVDSLQVSADGREALVLASGAGRWIELGGGQVTPIELRDVERGRASVEQRWVFEHVVRSVARLYYRPEYLSTIGWPEYVAEYRSALPAITHPADFAELMSELLGELNASHTTFEYRPTPPSGKMGSLGVRYDPGHRGAGLKVAEVLRASPLARAVPAVRAGDVVVQIDGIVISPAADPARYLVETAGKEVALTLRAPGGEEREVRVTPISVAQESALFYRRWVEHRQRETARLSGGRLGYVHLPWMAEDTFRALIDEVLGSLIAKEGIVLDTRYNQGGWLHGPLISFFSAPFAFALQAHGTVFATEPASRAGRPLVVLINQANYSNGYESARLFKELHLAKLVGEPIAGTGIGGAGDPLPYPEYSYGIAFDVSLTADGKYMEGAVQQPDVLVPADREAGSGGRDVQLEAAVRALLGGLR